MKRLRKGATLKADCAASSKKFGCCVSKLTFKATFEQLTERHLFDPFISTRYTTNTNKKLSQTITGVSQNTCYIEPAWYWTQYLGQKHGTVKSKH